MSSVLMVVEEEELGYLHSVVIPFSPSLYPKRVRDSPAGDSPAGDCFRHEAHERGRRRRRRRTVVVKCSSLTMKAFSSPETNGSD